MKKFQGRGIVIDPKTKKILCKFEDGVIKTDDTKIIEVLEAREKRMKEKEDALTARYEARLAKLKKAGIK